MQDNLKAALAQRHRAAEADILAELAVAARLNAIERPRVVARGQALLADLRAAQTHHWVNQFLQEYQLTTREGAALLGLAESFLRVPDRATADLLIRDKLAAADWAGHAGHAASILVNSATWGLVLAQALTGGNDRAGILRQLLGRVGQPFIAAAVQGALRRMGQVYVMGRTIGEALDRMSDADHRGFAASFDMLGEAARTRADADRYFESYRAAIAAIGRAAPPCRAISIKLSALHPRYETAQADICVPALVERLRALAQQAAALGLSFTIDAEEQDRLMLSLAIIEEVARDPALSGWEGFGMAVQAYGKRARPVIDFADALARATRRRMAVRLVKGAYWDSEIKRCQEAGLADYPVFTRKAATDVSYLACARALLSADHLFPAFASHNVLTVATLLEWTRDLPRDRFEFQRLHGMGDGLHERLVREQGYQCRIYAPVGNHTDLLAYLVRRLLENGANSSFVHQLADPHVTDADLLADPAEHIAAVGGAPHPAIPLPRNLFGKERRNSNGLDLQDAETLDRAHADIAGWKGKDWRAGPIVNGRVIAGTERPVLNPADPARIVGSVADAQPGDVAAAIAAAASAQPGWDAQPVEQRAACLDRLADLLEIHRAEFWALCIAEAGKILPDAVAEIREAVDFCRYYAMQARRQFAPVTLPGPAGEQNELCLVGRGVFACIAPWNFPLSIFLGQVAAALAAGNCVIAKPAPQTPLIAFRAVQLAHQAGIPAEALHLLPGGADMGRAIVQDVRIGGVAFTGSTAAAKRIARDLLADDHRPIVPLIAETGGVNAMIVDSTALPEQVAADVIQSAFQSAGQRCSALRLLLLQDDVADGMLAMLKGAMDMLVLGDPADRRTDVGPIIDRASRDRLETYRQSMRAQWLHALPMPDGPGFFVPPTLIRLDRIEDLTQEWFGPILHVARWRAAGLDDVIRKINGLGFGLTLGVHSRIEGMARQVRATARVGNLYINRPMIGAVVGCQPFGGEARSGSGPKAGGPNYLPRFATERSVSADATRSGGNAGLLSLPE